MNCPHSPSRIICIAFSCENALLYTRSLVRASYTSATDTTCAEIGISKMNSMGFFYIFFVHVTTSLSDIFLLKAFYAHWLIEEIPLYVIYSHLLNNSILPVSLNSLHADMYSYCVGKLCNHLDKCIRKIILPKMLNEAFIYFNDIKRHLPDMVE